MGIQDRLTCNQERLEATWLSQALSFVGAPLQFVHMKKKRVYFILTISEGATNIKAPIDCAQWTQAQTLSCMQSTNLSNKYQKHIMCFEIAGNLVILLQQLIQFIIRKRGHLSSYPKLPNFITGLKITAFRTLKFATF